MPDGTILSMHPEQVANSSINAWMQALLIDGAEADDPGVWIPLLPFHRLSLEQTVEVDQNSVGTMDATVTAYISNALVCPWNTYQLALGGSPTTGDVLTVVIQNPDLCTGETSIGELVVQYAVKSSDSSIAILTASLQAAIQAAITKATTQVPFGQITNLAAGNITCTTPGSGQININWRWPTQSPFNVTAAVNTGATETLTSAQIDNGDGFDLASTTTVGNQQLDSVAAWVRAAVSNWVSGKLTTSLVATSP